MIDKTPIVAIILVKDSEITQEISSDIQIILFTKVLKEF